MDCSLWVVSELLPKSKDFKYLRVLFKDEGLMKCEVDSWVGAASVVIPALCQTLVVMKELGHRAKLSIYQPIPVPTLTYGHNLWVVTDRIRLRIAEMTFLWRVSGSTLEKG